MSVLISVIVPVYNASRYLRRCVESIINQTYQQLEIILIDDGSTDESSSICYEYANKDKRVTVIHKENGGVSSARNKGMDKAKGHYLTFVDSDDCIHPRFCELMLNCIGQSDIAECHFLTILTEERIDYNQIESCAQYRIPAQDRKLSLLQNGGGRVWGCLFKTEMIKKLRFDNELKYCEDTVFTYDALNISNEVVQIQAALYYYTIHDQSAMSQIAKDGIDDIVRAEKMLYEKEKRLVSTSSIYKEKSTLVYYSIKVMNNLKKFKKWDDYSAFKNTNKRHLGVILSPRFKFLSFKEKIYLVYELFCSKSPVA